MKQLNTTANKVNVPVHKNQKQFILKKATNLTLMKNLKF